MQALNELRPAARPSSSRSRTGRASSSPSTRKRLLYAVVCADVPAAHRRRRYRRRRAVTAAAARPETLLRGPHPARLVSRAARTSRRRSRRCRPTWGTANQPPPTGTCRPPRNCSRWPPPARTRLVGGAVMTLIAPTLQAFFTDRLTQQRQASPRTIAAYRDTLRLLLTFVHQQTGKLPAQLDWDDLDATMISAFLNHLETERHNSTQDPQRPPDRDPLAVLLRRAAPPRARAAHPARAGDPAETVRQADRDVPDRQPRSTRCSPPRTRPAGKAGETGP